MTLISFPRVRFTNLVKTQAKIPTQEAKNKLLKKMLETNLKNKSQQEIVEYCIHELKLISEIVNAQGDRKLASENLSQPLGFSLPNKIDRIQKLLSLFENRNDDGSVQNINRTAAKYVEVLRQILGLEKLKSFISPNTFCLIENYNFDLIRSESNKWYRGNYIQNVAVRLNGDSLNIQLGRQNGTMGKDYELEVQLKPKQDDTSIQVTPEKQIKWREYFFSKYLNLVTETDGIIRYEGNFLNDCKDSKQNDKFIINKLPLSDEELTGYIDKVKICNYIGFYIANFTDMTGAKFIVYQAPDQLNYQDIGKVIKSDQGLESFYRVCLLAFKTLHDNDLICEDLSKLKLRVNKENPKDIKFIGTNFIPCQGKINEKIQELISLHTKVLRENFIEYNTVINDKNLIVSRKGLANDKLLKKINEYLPAGESSGKEDYDKLFDLFSKFVKVYNHNKLFIAKS